MPSTIRVKKEGENGFDAYIDDRADAVVQTALSDYSTTSQIVAAFAPISHTHGNITNAGAIGSTANLPLITTTNGVITTGTFGTTAGTFAQGNDARIVNAARTDIAPTFTAGLAVSAFGISITGGATFNSLCLFQSTISVASQATFNGAVVCNSVVDLANGVWHRSSSDALNRIFFESNARTIIRGHGSTPFELWNGGGSAIFRVGINGETTLFSGLNLAAITKASLLALTPNATTGGRWRVTDSSPAQREAYPDGTNWRWASDDAIVT